jgi:hypothetical protein
MEGNKFFIQIKKESETYIAINFDCPGQGKRQTIALKGCFIQTQGRQQHIENRAFPDTLTPL